MDFSIAQLLEQFTDDKLVAPKIIEKKLGITDDASIRKLQVTLDALEKIGILVKDKGRYRRNGEDSLIEGRLRCSSKGFCFAIQDAEGVEDIYIRESRLSTAWNGDRVLVKITKDGMRRRSPEGEVKLIVERSNPTLLARVKRTEQGAYRAVPLDDRLLFEIELVPDDNHPDLAVAADKLVHLAMVRYPLGSHLPKGRIAQVLGSDAESTNDIDLVRCKHNLPLPLTAEHLALTGSIPKALRKVDLKGRVDARDRLAVAVGTGMAISLTGTDEGWDLGIHIPDVAAFVAEGSEVDLLARQRLRSIFLEDYVLPMLPPIEALQQPEMLAVSVLVKLDRQGNLLSYTLQPTVVSVGARLSAVEAEALLDGSEPRDKTLVAIAQVLKDAHVVALLLRQHRTAGIAATLPEMRCAELDGGIFGIPVSPEATPIVGAMAEFAILANRAIATHLDALNVPTLFCGQAKADAGKIADWLKLVECMGVLLEPIDLGQLQPKDYKYLFDRVENVDIPSTRSILRYLLLSALPTIEYALSPIQHFGLGLSAEEPYTHAIDPQHRYADLLVQRILHTVFAEGRDRRSSRSKEGVDLRSSDCHGQVNWSVLPPEQERQCRADLEALVLRLTQANALAQRATTDLQGLRKARFMQAHVGQNFFGTISGVQSYGFFVEIESLFVEGLVHVSSLKDDWYEFPQMNVRGKGRQQTMLVGRRSGRRYALGDRIEVQVKSVDYYRQQIDLVAVASLQAALEGNSAAPAATGETQPNPATPEPAPEVSELP